MKIASALLVAFLATLAMPAQAADMAKVKKLLEEQHSYQCVMNSRTASNGDKAAAQQKYMQVQNQIGALQMEMMSDTDTQVQFINMRDAIGKKPCTDTASKADAKAAAGNAKKLVAQLRRQLCEFHSAGANDWITKGKAMNAADETRKALRSASASMENAGDKAGSDALDDEVRKIELAPAAGC